MQYKMRNDDNIYNDVLSGNKIINLLYSKKYMKWLLNILVGNSFVSRLSGYLMDHKISKCFISNFVIKNKINIDESVKKIDEFTCFNDFFTRRLKADSRPINTDGDVIISPADGKILVYESYEKSDNLYVKGKKYTLATLLQDDDLAQKYTDC